MKLTLTFFVSCFILGLSLIAIDAQANNANHTVSWGLRSFRDTHIHSVVIFKQSSWFGKVTDDFTWEQKNVPNPKIISQVVATDQYRNGKGGFATLSAGGPNQSFVKIHFTSQWFHGFNFIIDIYVR